MTRFKQGRSNLGRSMVLLLIILLVALSISSCGAEETKTYRVGVLAGISFLADIEAGTGARRRRQRESRECRGKEEAGGEHSGGHDGLLMRVDGSAGINGAPPLPG